MIPPLTEHSSDITIRSECILIIVRLYNVVCMYMGHMRDESLDFKGIFYVSKK